MDHLFHLSGRMFCVQIIERPKTIADLILRELWPLEGRTYVYRISLCRSLLACLGQKPECFA